MRSKSAQRGRRPSPDEVTTAALRSPHSEQVTGSAGAGPFASRCDADAFLVALTKFRQDYVPTSAPGHPARESPRLTEPHLALHIRHFATVGDCPGLPAPALRGADGIAHFVGQNPSQAPKQAALDCATRSRLIPKSWAISTVRHWLIGEQPSFGRCADRGGPTSFRSCAVCCAGWRETDLPPSAVSGR